MKYSEKFSLEIPMKEFYQMATPLIENKKELHKHIRRELMQCLNGMINGEFGGGYIDDWKEVFYKSLHKDGIIKPTQKCKDTYGEFNP